MKICCSNKRTLWYSILSLGTLAVFILLAVGSISTSDIAALGDYYLPAITTADLGNGMKEERHEYYWHPSHRLKQYYSLTGKQDGNNRWHGKLIIKYIELDLDQHEYCRYTEEVYMDHGLRHGPATMTLENGTYQHRWYEQGQLKKTIKKTSSAQMTSSFQVFVDRYPWYQYKLYPIDYGDDYMEAFLDTLDIVLEEYTFDENEFDNYYNEATGVLEETPYDSILRVNAAFSYLQGMERLKDFEFRLAVIDGHRQAELHTFEMVQTKYPGLLDAMQQGDVGEQDFGEFCRVFDSCMMSYGPLDQYDFFFVDSVDTRIFRTILEIYASGQSDTTESPFKKAADILSCNQEMNSLYKNARSVLSALTPGSSPAEVAEVMLFFIFMHFDQGDIIKKTVKKAWYINHDVTSLPVVTTAYDTAYSSTSAILRGTVFEDGEAEVSSRGIAWAEHYNPTTEDQTEAAGGGTGEFSVTLEGLSEGSIYYARSYAINSMGTAYGNCVEFIATGASGIHVGSKAGIEMNIYPNPATALANFIFHVPSAERMEMTLVNLNGQVVHRLDLGILPVGEQRFELDLSLLQDGTYHCHITAKGRIISSRKLVIAR
jgi:hypothetical protein